MSIAYQAKDSAVAKKQLETQELTLTSSDAQLFVVSGMDLVVLVKEEVVKAISAQVQVAAGTITGVAAADVSLVDSVTLLPGGDKKAIKLAGVAAPVAGDAITVKYTTKQ